jgi:hypothetical protein
MPTTLSKERLVHDMGSGKLVSPQGKKWHDFFKFLKSKLPDNEGIPNPLILGGSGANAFTKNERLKEHLKVAEDNGVLDEALDFLCGLSKSAWEMSDGNLDPNEPDYWDLIAEDESEDED